MTHIRTIHGTHETKSALEKAASAKEIRRKNSLQLEHLGEYISWLSQAKNKLREDQRDLDAQINRRRLEQQEVATLRKALDRTVRISRLSPPFCYS